MTYPAGLATWGPLVLVVLLGAVVVWQGVLLARLARRCDELQACRLPVYNESLFQRPYLGRCERRDDHPPEKCQAPTGWG